MNYKTVDVADVIGAILYSNMELVNLSPARIFHVMSLVHERDKFVSVDMSRSAYIRVIDIAEGGIVWEKDVISFKNGEVCKTRFLGCYYSVDIQTRNLLDTLVAEIGE